MAHRKTSKRSKAKTILRLPDLEQSKNAVLHSLAAASSQESYGHAIDEFIGWYCSEPRLALNRTVVLRYRFFLEQKNLAPSTINVRLAAVRRLAHEGSDTGLLSPELAAGVRRVKGAYRDEGDGTRSGWTPPPVEQQKHSWEGRGAITTIPGTLTKQETFFYTLSLPISTAIIGCDSVEQVEECVELARSFTPLSQAQMAAMEAKVEPVAKQALFFRLMPR